MDRKRRTVRWLGAIDAICVWPCRRECSVYSIVAVVGDAARFETADPPDTHVYLTCPQCGRRADTGFTVPFSRKMEGRYSLFYDWERRKMIKPQVIVHLRRRGGGKKKLSAKLVGKSLIGTQEPATITN
jgi:hypothetical protein